MKPFLVHATVVTPLISPGFLTLDAILLAELALHVGEEKAMGELPLAVRDGVPQASQGYYDLVGIRQPYAKAAKLGAEPQGLDPDKVRFKRNGRPPNLKGIMSHFEAESVNVIMWSGVGDVTAVGDLLWGIRSVGKRRADGFGRLAGSPIIEEIEAGCAEWGLVDQQGEPMRPVPMGVWATLGGGTASPAMMVTKGRPRYWDPAVPSQTCAIPMDKDPARLAGAL